MRTFLWKGNSDRGYAKVAWNQVCLPLDEGGLGIRDVQALNYALMSKHLWAVISNRNYSIWVQWVRQYCIRHKTVWMVNANANSWCWRKLLRLLVILQSQLTDTSIVDTVSMVILNGMWFWPPLTDPEYLQIIQSLHTLHGGMYMIVCKLERGTFTTKAAYRFFHLPNQKLSTMDKPLLSHLDGGCSLCTDGQVESHSHLFFNCRHSRHCIATIRRQLRFPWPNEWGMDITWVARRWRGKHIINAAYRALLASLIYHLWQERNRRKFQQIERPLTSLVTIILNECRQRILSIELSCNLSTIALYRLWRIL
ncbi:hypothetical protein Sango_2088200 [Sesamum angolense]|uniref:Reverse transcriptase zinc-binding domain-containing protein n=1 Tax=Sesamum angolense TaxID=2727404 RepID=A0AAE1WBB2_9LAMI|nr:hypothetical protein Sango_2088200 [Sesamum angolense]